jgi:hypothetical protein
MLLPLSNIFGYHGHIQANMAEAAAHRTIRDFQLKKSKDLPSLGN